jgi:hypothetical protein
MSGFIALSAASTFALALMLAPGSALAQSSGAYPAPSHHRPAAPRHVRRPPAEARLARPTFGPPSFVPAPFGGPVPREDRNIPAISRDPNDCVKTMCTCIGGGGC